MVGSWLVKRRVRVKASDDGAIASFVKECGEDLRDCLERCQVVTEARFGGLSLR
jgi:hypothetical protein